MSDVIKKDGKFLATRSIANGDSMFIDSNVMDGMLEEQINDIKNPMPPKPLEAMLKEFVSEQPVLDGDLERGKKFIRQVWAAALEYGAEKILTTEQDRTKEGDNSIERAYAAYSQGIAQARLTLLEEAKKALE